MFFTYVLPSVHNRYNYVGYTNNLKRRLEDHIIRAPLKLIYFEACLNHMDARCRENYLKTTQGRRFLGLRLKEYRHRQASGVRGW